MRCDGGGVVSFGSVFIRLYLLLILFMVVLFMALSFLRALWLVHGVRFA